MKNVRSGGIMAALAAAFFSLPALAANGGGYDVQRYDLALRFYPGSKSFAGTVTVTGVLEEKTDSVALDASLKLLTIDSVAVDGHAAGFRRAGDVLLIPAPAGAFSIRIAYRGVSGFSGTYDAGGVLFTSKDGFNRIATISEPNFARTWWPCHDVPFDKALVTVSVTVPKDLRAVSNGTETAVDRGAGTPWATYRWESRYPISTYLVAVAAAPYSEIHETYTRQDGERMPVVYYVYPADTERARNDFANIRSAIRFFASNFCEYPFAEEKFGIAEVDGDMTMENQTICTVESTLLTGDRKNELTFVHELAHHWWGNLVTPHDWTQTWLSEGFATYAEALYLEQTRGRDVYQTYIDNMMAQPQGSYAGSVTGRSDTAFWDSFAVRVYYKGAIVLHMLRSIMGDTAFFHAMRSYLGDETLRYKSAVTADFEKHCEAAYGASLGWFFGQWIAASTDSIDRPELAWSWRRTDGGAELSVRQTTAGQLLYRLPLDVDVVTGGGTEHFSVTDSLEAQTFRLATASEPTSVRIDPGHKVFKLLTETAEH